MIQPLLGKILTNIYIRTIMAGSNVCGIGGGSILMTCMYSHMHCYQNYPYKICSKVDCLFVPISPSWEQPYTNKLWKAKLVEWPKCSRKFDYKSEIKLFIELPWTNFYIVKIYWFLELLILPCNITLSMIPLMFQHYIEFQQYIDFQQ